MAGNKFIGTLPVNNYIESGTYLIFAGRRWLVRKTDQERKIIELSEDKGGRPPQFDSSYGFGVHKSIRQKMLNLYESDSFPQYLDNTGKALFQEGRNNFLRYNLGVEQFIDYGSECYFFPWESDKVMNTLVLLMQYHKLKATNEGICVHVKNATRAQVLDTFMELLKRPELKPGEIISSESIPRNEKYDRFLPDGILQTQACSKYLDVKGAYNTAKLLL
jgi:ATP-dependent Lhr-like helicase